MAPKRIAGLEPYREDEGFISLQVDFHGHHRKARKRAGITKWPEDICRHTFASNHFSEFTRLMVEMSHTTTKVLFAHYHRHVPEPGKQGEGGDFTLHHQSSIFNLLWRSLDEQGSGNSQFTDGMVELLLAKTAPVTAYAVRSR